MQEQQQPRRLLKPQQVADRLNIELRTAYDMLAEGGALHHLRIQLGHKTLRVDPDALEHFIKTRPAANASS